MRFSGLILSSVAFFSVLTPAVMILELEEGKSTALPLVLLSIPLVLTLSFILSAAGRAEGLANSSGGQGWASSLQKLGFPIAHRHAWGDFGRLYALFFLCFVGPLIPTAFATLIASGLIGFEQTIAVFDDGTGLTESEAIVQIAQGKIALEGADLGREAQVNLIRDWSYRVSLALFLPLLVKLIPFYFWRSGGREAPTLADTWRRVSWASALLFGLFLLTLLAVCFVLPVPLIGRYAVATIGIALWAYFYARQVGEYDQS